MVRKPLQPGPLAVGHRVRLRQPRLPVLTYAVDMLEPGRAFSWTASSVGVSTSAIHEVERTDDGCRLALGLGWSGPLAGLVALAYGRLTRKYLRWEVEGLKRFARAVGQLTAPGCGRGCSQANDAGEP